MNKTEIRAKVHSAMYELLKEKGFASPADVLMKIGALSKEDYDKWRHGKADYLERSCKLSLGKLTSISGEIRAYAKQHRLKPTFTDYRKWGKGEKYRLRFSKSGDERIEQSYATHYLGKRDDG
jgi:hypothetical protein